MEAAQTLGGKWFVSSSPESVTDISQSALCLVCGAISAVIRAVGIT